MKNVFDLKGDKKGASAKGAVITLVGVVIVLILVSQLAPTALVGLFNATAFSGVPAWVVTTLGIMGAIAFIMLILKLVD